MPGAGASRTNWSAVRPPKKSAGVSKTPDRKCDRKPCESPDLARAERGRQAMPRYKQSARRRRQKTEYRRRAMADTTRREAYNRKQADIMQRRRDLSNSRPPPP